MNFGGQLAYMWKGVIGAEALADFAPSIKIDSLALAEHPQVNSYMANIDLRDPARRQRPVPAVHLGRRGRHSAAGDRLQLSRLPTPTARRQSARAIATVRSSAPTSAAASWGSQAPSASELTCGTTRCRRTRHSNPPQPWDCSRKGFCPASTSGGRISAWPYAGDPRLTLRAAAVRRDHSQAVAIGSFPDAGQSRGNLLPGRGNSACSVRHQGKPMRSSRQIVHRASEFLRTHARRGRPYRRGLTRRGHQRAGASKRVPSRTRAQPETVRSPRTAARCPAGAARRTRIRDGHPDREPVRVFRAGPLCRNLQAYVRRVAVADDQSPPHLPQHLTVLAAREGPRPARWTRSARESTPPVRTRRPWSSTHRARDSRRIHGGSVR